MFYYKSNLFPLLLAVVLSLLFSCNISAEESPFPSWWKTDSMRILNSGVHENNHLPVSVWQLRHTALVAIAHFENTMGSDGIGATLTNLKASLLASAKNPKPADYTPANLAQAKAIIIPFYNRMIEIGINPSFFLVKAGYPEDWDSFYPFKCPPQQWAVNSNAEPECVMWALDDYRPINIGQLKTSFIFDLDTFANDFDGIPLAWILKHFGSLSDFDPYADADGDGLTNRQEYEHGTNPNNIDTDGDGLPDAWEINNGLDPLIVNEAVVAGVPLKELYAQGKNLDWTVYPLPPASIFTVAEKSLTEIKLQWRPANGEGDDKPGSLPAQWVFFKDGDLMGTFPGSTLSCVDTQITIPPDDGVTIIYSIAAANEAGVLGPINNVTVRVGDFVEAEVALSVKQWNCRADGGIRAFLPNADGDYNYYNRQINKSTSRYDERAHSSAQYNERSVSILPDGTSEDSSYTSHHLSKRESWKHSGTESYFEFKVGKGLLHTSGEVGSRSESSSSFSGTGILPGSSSEISSEPPTTTSSSTEIFSSIRILLDEPFERGVDFEHSVRRKDTNPDDVVDDKEESDNVSHEHGAYLSWTRSTKSFQKIVDEQSHTSVLSELITPAMRLSWCHEMMESGRDVAFGESKTSTLAEAPSYQADYHPNKIMAERFADNKSASLKKGVLKFRITGEIEKHNRYYVVMLETFTPYDKKGALLPDERRNIYHRIGISDAFINECLQNPNSYPSQEYRLDPPDTYGKSEISFGGNYIKINAPLIIPMTPVLPSPDDAQQ